MDQVQFLQFANTLPEAMLLVTAEGLVLAANQAAMEDLNSLHLVGTRLQDLVVDAPEKLTKFLRLCRRSRNFIFSALEFRGGSDAAVRFRVEGALVQPKSEDDSAVVMLRLTSKATALHQFVVLNQRIDELGRELQLRMQAEARTREEHEKLRVTLNSIGDAVIATDEHGIITMLNPFAERLTGWTTTEAIGSPLVDVFRIINETTRQPVSNPALTALREQRVVALANHTLLISRDGTEWAIDDSASPIRDDQGCVIGAILVFRDISERKIAEQHMSEQSERLRTTLANARLLASIIESSQDSILRTSMEGVIQTWNRGAQQLFGYTPEEAIGRPIFLLIPPDLAHEEVQIMDRIRAGERVEHYETVRIKKCGELVDISLTVSPIRNELGEVVAASKIARDISRQKRAERSLIESEQRYRALTEATATVVWRTSSSGELFFASDIWLDITGQTKEQLKGHGWLEAIHPEDRDQTVALWTHSLKTRTLHENQFRVRQADGSYRWFSVRGVPIFNNDGTVREWVGANTDIHDRVSAEETLRMSEAFNRTVIESSPDCLKVLDAEGALLTINTHGRCIMEIDDFRPLIGKPWFELWPEEARSKVKNAIELARRREFAQFEGFCPTAKGTPKWWEVNVAPVIGTDGNVDRIVAASRDISYRKRAEEELRDSETRLALGVQLAGLALVEIDFVNGKSHLTAEAARYFGLGDQAMIVPRGTIHDLFHPEDREQVMANIAKALDPGGEGWFAMDLRIICPSKEVRWLRARKQVFFSGTGESRKAEKALLAILDISFEKNAVESVRLSAELVHGVLDSLPEQVVVLDEHGIVSMLNEPWHHLAEEQGGFLKRMNIGSNYLEVWERSEAQSDLRSKTMLPGLRDVLAKRRLEFVTEYACEIAGQERWFLMHARRTTIGPPGVILSHVDITQQHQFEQSLQEALKMAEAASRAKSAFLANMSHEIRTPMTAILGYTDLIAEQVTQGEISGHLSTIRKNGDFLLEIINDILDLSKIEAGKFEATKKRFSPVALIEDVLSIMVVRARERKIELTVEYQGYIPANIESDAKCLKQILINLVGNAIKFTKQGSVSIKVSCSDEILRIAVVDTGIGMTREQQTRVFEPFSQADASVSRIFGGTGLGLAITSRLAKALGGEVSVQSELGTGSTFTVTIATGNLTGVSTVDYDLHEPAEESLLLSPADIRLDCKILIVDDRREIRMLSRHFLTKAGAVTREAEEGEQALRVVEDERQNNSNFDLILLDMQMPRLDGYATAAALRKMGYKGPIIALTADAMQGDMNRCLESGCDDYLSKPIDKQKLLEKVSYYLARYDSNRNQ